MNILLRSISGIALLSALPLSSALAADPIGKLYTMSNATTGNEILVYSRRADGSLSQTDHVGTYGLGTGTGLGNQSALTLSGDGALLFAVNAGNNSISSFRITATGLEFVKTVSSGGVSPVSLTEDRGRLFVLNAGDATHGGNISGFWTENTGDLEAIHNSRRPLSNAAAGTGAAQISFSDNGKQLIVTEKATNLILTYRLNDYNRPSWPKSNTSSGATPFGFAVGKRNQFFVSNAAGGAANGSSLSSYKLLASGQLNTISPTVGAGETAACWVTLTPDGRYAFTTNTGSGTISSFRIGFNGAVAVENNDSGITGAGTAPIDMDISPDSRILYTLNSGNETISSFSVGLNGDLTLVKTLTGLPDGANGLVVQ
ncbi:lactonase family protein [Crenothrix sp.]|uniref:lactonase family protein n=1 Tax=Crenothrix sp. TaxID=3100433 RepID=UPI00374D2EBF